MGLGADPATGTWLTVVGVVGDVRVRNFRQETADPVVYPARRPDGAELGGGVTGVRREVVTRRVAGARHTRAAAQRTRRKRRCIACSTMETLAIRAMAQLSFTTLMLAIAAGLALVLGTVGLYGVLSYVDLRNGRARIAVRMALGAERASVRRMVVLQGGRVALVGVALGVVVALGVTGVLQSLLFGVQAFDAVTFLGMSGLMLAVALLASYLPASWASAVDPMEALRGE